MDCMKIYMKGLVLKVEMEENNAIVETQNLDSEIQIKQFKGLLILKEKKLQK